MWYMLGNFVIVVVVTMLPAFLVAGFINMLSDKLRERKLRRMRGLFQ